MDIFWTIIFYIFFSCLVGALAKRDGRDFWIWFAISAIISPLIGAMILLIVHLVDDKKDDKKDEKKEE